MPEHKRAYIASYAKVFQTQVYVELKVSFLRSVAVIVIMLLSTATILSVVNLSGEITIPGFAFGGTCPLKTMF